MDPTANLKEQLELATQLIDTGEDVANRSYRLAELVLALNEWILKGGFLPTPWHNAVWDIERKRRTPEVKPLDLTKLIPPKQTK